MAQTFKDKDKIYCHLKKNDDCYYVNEIYLMAISKDFYKLASKKAGFIGAYALFLLSTVLSGALILVNLLYEKKIDYNKELAIARVSRERNKIANVLGEIQFIGDDIKNKDFTIYRIGPRRERIIFFIKSYVKYCYDDLKRIKEILSTELLSSYDNTALLWLVKRIPHTVVYKYAIENIISNYKLTDIYVGATHERFALIVENSSKINKKRLICIPHGIETTEKMPRGYVGDIFYCSSNEMATKLNFLYNTSKFIFDSDVTRQMYRINDINIHEKMDKKKRVVFFTQPIFVEQTKQIIERVANNLGNKNIKLYIKIHPIEKPSEYSIYNTELIYDFNDSIYGNICISVLSTILVEAIYNESQPISIINLVSEATDLTGDREFLIDNRIYKPKNEAALIELVDNLYN